MVKQVFIAAATLWTSSQLSACAQHPEVPDTECPKVVSHARKLLGDRADPPGKMLAQCKEASGQERGCALNAGSAADLLRCSM